MKHVLWILKTEGNPNFWDIKKGHQPPPPACLLTYSSSTCWSDTGLNSITAAAAANFPIRKRNSSKAAWPPLKFVSSNRSGSWRQRVDLWALKAEGGLISSEDREKAEWRDLHWSLSPQTQAREGSKHPSRNRRFLKLRCNPSQAQPEGCSRIWRQLPAEQPLVLCTDNVSEPLYAFGFLSSAQYL